MEVPVGVSGQLTPDDRKALLKRIARAALFVVACVALKLPYIAIIVFAYFFCLYYRYRPSTVDLLVLGLAVAPLMGPFGNAELGGLPDFRFQFFFVLLLLASLFNDREIKSRRFLSNGLDTAILVFIAACLLSIAASIMYRTPLRTFLEAILIPFGYYLVAKNCIRRPDFLPKLYLAVILAAFAFGMLGLYEAVTKRNLLDYGEAEMDVYRVSGPMRMAEDYGICMNILLLFCLSMATSGKAGLIRGSFRRLAYLVGFLAVFFTLTRGIWLSLTTGSLVLFARRKTTMFLMAVPVVVLVVWVMLDVVIPRLSGDIWVKRVTNRKTINARLATYKSALLMFQDYPLLGVGYGAFGEVQERNPKYQTEYLGEPAVDTPHNLFLSLLSETGLIGIAVAALVLIYVFRFSARVAGNAMLPVQRDFGEAIIAITVAYLVAGFGNDFARNLDFVNKYLFIFLGGLSGMVDLQKPSNESLGHTKDRLAGGFSSAGMG